MIRSITVAIGWSILAACASRGHGVAATEGVEPAEVPVTASGLAGVQVVPIEELDTGLECERIVPTGSRIATERCYTREERTNAGATYGIIQQDIEELRRQQMYRDMASAEARRHAIASGVSR